MLLPLWSTADSLPEAPVPRVNGMPKAKHPTPEPIETDERRVVLVGMALWLVAFVVLALFFRDDVSHSWFWTCGIALALGLYGLRFVSRRRR